MENQTSKIALSVNRVIKGNSNNGYSRVIVDKNVFNAVSGMTPAIEPIKNGVNAEGHNTRVFKFGDAELVSIYDRSAQKTTFLMKDEDAKAHLTSENVVSELCLSDFADAESA